MSEPWNPSRVGAAFDRPHARQTAIPDLDEEVRLRLGRRFGSAIDAWFDTLPAILRDLGERWEIEWGPLVRRGSMSVVIHCRAADGRPAVLKVSPERARVADEAAALASWRTLHVPAVLGVDERAGALLLEAIEPGTPLVESPGYPSLERVVALLTSLHRSAARDRSFPPVGDRVARLFDSGTKPYERSPGLTEVVPRELYERGRELALRLAGDATPTVLLHGDLTPVNVLDGGPDRGLVAIDPAPCLGDPAFDAVDLVFWRAEDTATITTRAEELAAATGTEAGRILAWCAAFAAMAALERAEAGDGAREVEALVALASAV